MKTRAARIRVWIGLVLLLVLEAPAPVRAGMPSVTLSDLPRMRIQTISFFLLVWLASSWVVLRIWNGLTRDFPGLPRLDFKKSVGLVTLWSLLFVLVLTMISGARELMTPAHWKKQGFTYSLIDEPGGYDRPGTGKGDLSQ